MTPIAHSPLTESAWAGRLVHLAGIDVIGPTAGSLARLLQDREAELWEGNRVVCRMPDGEPTVSRPIMPAASAHHPTSKTTDQSSLTQTHPSFRVIASASKSLHIRDWLTDEHANMVGTLSSIPMPPTEELDILLSTGCNASTAKKVLEFASAYRASLDAAMKESGNRGSNSNNVHKSRRLGTRALVRIARWCARFPWDEDLYSLFARALLIEFLPPTERTNVETLMKECGIERTLELVC
jgi:hypothetical protein